MITNILIAIFVQAQVPVVEVSVVARQPYKYLNQSMRVCGQVDNDRIIRSVWYISQESPWGKESIFVSPDFPKLISKATICLDGAFRRVDGLTAEEASNQGKALHLTDAPNGQYMLFPLAERSHKSPARKRSQSH